MKKLAKLFGSIDRMLLLGKTPDEWFLKCYFFLAMGKKLNLTNPETFNEKLQWLKLHDRDPLYTRLADKYEVRKFVAEKIGEKYLIPLLGVWDHVDDIDFEKLPDRFVLKCNHDSSGIVICSDKSRLDIPRAKKKIRRRMRKNWYYKYREWAYKDIKPRVICEKYMVDESGTDLKDYKIFCFNGEPKYIQVDFDRFVAHKRNLYDTEWNAMDLEIGYPSDRTRAIPKPPRLEEMLTLASKLSAGIPQVRADFYSTAEGIFFGELTLYHAGGFKKFSPPEWDKIFGAHIVLP